MVCDLCRKNEAQIFLEAVGNNGKRKVNLCLQCAAARGLHAPVASAPDARNLESIFAELDKRELAQNPENSKLCPVCGRSLALIRKTGNTGCPECYEIFKAEIIKEMTDHGIYGKYTGSMPLRLVSFRNALTDRADLQAKLDEAVRNENYEKAAVYRDFLKALERGAVSDGTLSDNSDEGELEDLNG